MPNAGGRLTLSALQHLKKHAWQHQTAAGNAGTLRSFTTRVAHVLPVSDDGGSTAEIVRVLGGPAVGDIRSRCLRLADDSNTEVPTDRIHHCLDAGKFSALKHKMLEPSRHLLLLKSQW